MKRIQSEPRCRGIVNDKKGNKKYTLQLYGLGSSYPVSRCQIKNIQHHCKDKTKKC